MRMCRACNTRFAEGTVVCPSCGRRAADHSADAGSSGSAAIPLPHGRRVEPDDDEIDLELDEDDVVKRAIDPPKRFVGAVAAPRAEPEVAVGVPGVDAARVRVMLAEQPALLEKGLGLHADDEGDPLGIDFPTPVGSIDLLGRDRKGAFVVVHVPESDEVGDSLSGMLRRMGWVRKHLASAGEDVRGIVVVEQLPEDLAYAAAGLGGAIAFKGYCLSLTFHDLEG
jgi:uncharacterized Zn finger protein (UPF0148 family)